MTKVWKLKEAKTHLSQLMRDSQREPQVISRHGKVVALVTPMTSQAQVNLAPQESDATSALDALLGDFDFIDFPDEDLFPRQHGPMRDQGL